MHRRDTLKLFAGALVASALPIPFVKRAAGAAERHAPYKGTTIVVNWPSHPHFDIAQRFIPQFTEETGIKVELDRMQYVRMRDKQLLELSKPQSDYDVVTILGTWKTEYASKKLIGPLQPMIDDAALADPQYDLADIVPAYLEQAGLVGGPKGYLAGPGAEIYALPFGQETSIFAYRKDLFDQHGLKPPTTYDELTALLPQARDKTGIGALTSRGQSGHQATHAFLLHLNPLGGRIFDDAWNPIFAQEPGVKALDTLKLISETGPSGIPGFGFGEMQTAFLQGQAAMYLDSIVIFGDVKNPEKSRVDGKVAYALHPRGARNSAQSGGFALAVPSRSANREAGFLFAEWLTSKAQDLAIAMAGGAAMRNSTLHDAGILAKYPEYALLREQLRHTDPDWRPIIPEWSGISEQILGTRISEVLTGGATPQAALEAAVGPTRDVMLRAGLLKS